MGPRRELLAASAPAGLLLPNGSLFAQRPVPRDDESWPGAPLRLTERNQLRGLSQLAALFNVNPYYLVQLEPEAAWNAIVGDARIESSMTMPRTEQRCSVFSRVCAQCLRSDPTPYIRAEWDKPLSLVCPIHKTLLLDSCPYCGRPIDYLRRHVMACQCGNQFAEESPSAPPWIEEMLGLFIDVHDPMRSARFSRATALEMQAARVLIRIADFQGRGTPILRSGRRKRQPQLRRAHLVHLEAWFSDGVSSFLAKIRELREEEPPWPRLRASLGLWMFPKLSSAITDAHASVTSQLRGQARESNNYLRARDLTNLLRASSKTIAYWCDIGLIPRSSFVEGEPSRIHSSVVASIQHLFEGSCEQDEASRVLGISKPTVTKLVLLEAIERAGIRKTAGRDRVQRASVASLAKSFLSRADSTGMSNGRVSFEDVVSSINSPREWANFQSLLQGKISIFVRARGNCLADVRFVRRELVEQGVL